MTCIRIEQVGIGTNLSRPWGEMGCAKASPERRAYVLARPEAEIEAAASSPSLLCPTGAGKLMLARLLSTIPPAMTLAEAIETMRPPRRWLH